MEEVERYHQQKMTIMSTKSFKVSSPRGNGSRLNEIIIEFIFLSVDVAHSTRPAVSVFQLKVNPPFMCAQGVPLAEVDIAKRRRRKQN